MELNGGAVVKSSFDQGYASSFKPDGKVLKSCTKNTSNIDFELLLVRFS